MTNFWQRNAPLMGLQYIRRWALVQMDRDQTVSDHAFRVWVLARDLHQVLDPIGHNTYDLNSTQLWALIHDADEYWTSDLPGHFKRALKELAPGAVDKYTEGKFTRVMPEYIRVARGIKGTVVDYVVKLCDLLESLVYIQRHGLRPQQVRDVSKYITDRYDEVRREAVEKFKELNWDRLDGWVNEVLAGDQHEDFQLVAGLTPGPQASQSEAGDAEEHR